MEEKVYKILLVEDELFIRELYERVLQKTGFSVVAAPDGEEGLLQSSTNPDLILLDIMMPKLNGIELLGKLKADKKTREIPVVLLTNLGQESIIKKAIEMGATGYLMKMKLTPYDLVIKVKEFLANPHMKQNMRELNLD